MLLSLIVFFIFQTVVKSVVPSASCSNNCSSTTTRPLPCTNCLDGTCTSDCNCNLGYQPTTGGVSCQAICGNGVLDSGEACDGGPQCSNCQCFPGYKPDNKTDLGCAPLCGDGIVETSNNETCDNGANLGNDGCTFLCTLSPGWVCLNSNCTTPTPNCTDTLIVGTEQCIIGSLGCGSSCPGVCTPNNTYEPNEPPSAACRTICGNGRIDSQFNETCDWAGGEFCNHTTCQCFSPGYYPVNGSIACAPRCGDKIWAPPEMCDGSVNCTSSCVCDIGYISAPNGTCINDCGDQIVVYPEICDSGADCLTNCTCPDGEEADPKSNGCMAIDYCQIFTAGPHSTCTSGSLSIFKLRYIQCDTGYYAQNLTDPTIYLTVADGNKNDTCKDINECLAAVAGCGTAACNESGSSGGVIPINTRICTCPVGQYAIDTFDSSTGASAQNETLTALAPFGGCANLCGNQFIDPGETCDSVANCTSNCTCATGFQPTTPLQLCKPICGNGMIDSGEMCDSGTGCSNCKCTTGYNITSPISVDCQDIDECTYYKTQMANTVSCVNSPYPINNLAIITCGVGFFANGTSSSVLLFGGAPWGGCVAIDECKDRGFAPCTNCTCVSGVNNRTVTCPENFYAVAPAQRSIVLIGDASFGGCTSFCGNGQIDPGEDCDVSSGDTCTSSCKCVPGYQVANNTDGTRAIACQAICGNGVLDPGEQCDPGTQTHSGGAFCNSDCKCIANYGPNGTTSCVNLCGNGILDPNTTEVCDSGTGCDSCQCSAGYVPINGSVNCQYLCGNGKLDSGEACDGGLGCSNCQCLPLYKETAIISVNCILICGDGTLDANEQCDSGAHCTACKCDAGYEPDNSPSCRAICGNGVINFGEQCDSGSNCTANCTCLPNYETNDDPVDINCQPICGNGKLDEGRGEQCDALGAHCLSNCTCDIGYGPDPLKTINCLKTDECISDTAGYSGRQNNTAGCEDGLNERTITCQPGYTVDPTDQTVVSSITLLATVPFQGCFDIDECQLYGYSGAGTYAKSCAQDINQRTITCQTGYWIAATQQQNIVLFGNASFTGCSDIPECQFLNPCGDRGTANCSEPQVGMRLCTCLPGYHSKTDYTPSKVLIGFQVWSAAYDCVINHGCDSPVSGLSGCKGNTNYNGQPATCVASTSPIGRTCKCPLGFFVSGTTSISTSFLTVGQVFPGCTEVDGCLVYGCPETGKKRDNQTSSVTCVNGAVNQRICTCPEGEVIIGAPVTTDLIYQGDQQFSGCRVPPVGKTESFRDMVMNPGALEVYLEYEFPWLVYFNITGSISDDGQSVPVEFFVILTDITLTQAKRDLDRVVTNWVNWPAKLINLQGRRADPGIFPATLTLYNSASSHVLNMLVVLVIGLYNLL